MTGDATTASARGATTTDQGVGQDHGAHEHLMPVATYLKIYAALLVLTGVTVGVSLLDLGAPAIYVALAVAVIKGSLVAAYFMHLRYDAGFNRLVFAGSLLFLVIFFVFTMIDLGARGSVMEEQDTLFKRQEDLAQPAGAPAAPPAPSKPSATTPR